MGSIGSMALEDDFDEALTTEDIEQEIVKMTL
jgi:hypothetical protein